MTCQIIYPVLSWPEWNHVDDRVCGKPAKWIHEGDVPCCDKCAEGMRGEGFEVVPLETSE